MEHRVGLDDGWFRDSLVGVFGYQRGLAAGVGWCEEKGRGLKADELVLWQNWEMPGDDGAINCPTPNTGLSGLRPDHCTVHSELYLGRTHCTGCAQC